MQKAELTSLFDQYLAETIAASDLRRLWETLEQPEHEAAWAEFIEQLCHRETLHGLTDSADVELALSSLKRQMAPLLDTAVVALTDDDSVQSPTPVHFLRKWGWAAAILLVLGTGIYFWTTGNKSNVSQVATAKPGEIAPGRDGAILTLADGSQVVLDSLGNGVIAVQNGAQAVIRNGKLEYDVTGVMPREMVYNTIATPKGRQFSLLLPDGSRVWLNAASSIRFPTRFIGQERCVNISGEAYFEVAKNAAMPFRVSLNNGTNIEVLGTHFNVQAYEDEHSIYTTLLEGRVKTGGLVLAPGQQAQMSRRNPGNVKRVSEVDIDNVMAWKNGLFNFNGASLQQVMKQLERWYNIEVVYEKGVPNIGFGGKMTKSISLNGVLIALEKSEVHFRLEGRKLIVMP